MKKTTVILGIIIYILTILSNMFLSKVVAKQLSPELYFGIIELRKDTNFGYSMGSPIANGETGPSAKLWNIVQYDNASGANERETNLYCVRAGAGFTTSTTAGLKVEKYNLEFDMYKDRDEIAKQDQNTSNKILYNLVNSEYYNSLLALANIIYVPGVSTEEEKQQLLNASGVTYVWEDFEGIKGEEYYYITDDEIEAVQQAAVWYFTNYDEMYEGDRKYDKTDESSWLWYTENGKDYSNLEDYDPTNTGYQDQGAGYARQQQVVRLYNYLIKTAKANAEQYSDPNGKYKNKLTLYATSNDRNAQPLMKIERNPQEFDLALRKSIVSVTNNEGKGKEITNIEGENAERQLNTNGTVKNINQTTIQGATTTAEYYNRKDPVVVNTGDYVTYSISIYNEGEKAGRATKIVDQLPTGLEFTEVVSGNFEVLAGGYNETTNILTLTRKSGNTSNLQAYDGTRLSSEVIQIKCKVTGIAGENNKILTNLAWISEEVDGVTGETITTQVGKDRDSEPGTISTQTKDELVTEDEGYRGNDSNNGKNIKDNNSYFEGQQDDDDFEKIVIPKATGNYQLQLEKVDEEGNLITTTNAGFSWRLPGNAEDKTETTTNGVLDLGTVEITEEGADSITITETKAPEGYNKLIESITVEVTKEISEGKYVAVNPQITSGNTNENASVSIDGNVIKVIVKNTPKEFDLALRKFITKVDETPYNREPQPDTSTIGTEGTAQYNHTKEPIMVKRKSEITYTIRVYNEGEIDGYAEEVTDYIPEGLEFLPENTVNQQYGWVMYNAKGEETESEEEAVEVRTDYLSKEKNESGNLIKAYDGQTLSYKELQVVCKVKPDVKSNVKLTNLAEITEDYNKYDYPDKDSTPDNIEKPTGEDLPNYKDDEIEEGKTYIPGQEDDDDFEKVLVEERTGSYELQLQKVDEEGELITTSNAGFSWRLPGDRVDKTGETSNGILDLGTVEITEEGTDSITITETKAPEGYNKLIDSITVEVTKEISEGKYVAVNPQITSGNTNENASVSIDGNVIKITVKNEKIEGIYQLQLEKVDEEGNLITTSNAGFSWTLPGQSTAQTGTTSNGILNLGTVEITEEGTDNITITETKAPEGYNKLIDSITVEVEKGISEQDTNTFEVINATLTSGETQGAKVELNGNVITITIPNEEIKEFDLALRKFITEVDGTSYNREPQPDTTTIPTTGTAEYNHTKQPIIVNRDSEIIYIIRVYNEGEIDGYVEEVTDYIPEGLEFLPEHEINQQYEWVMYNAEGNETQNAEEAVEIRTDYLSKEKETEERQNLIKAFDGTTLDYKEIQVACKVAETAEADVKLTNYAEITDDYNEENEPDKDSTPEEPEKPTDEELPNYKDEEIERGDKYIPGQEDDDDFEKVIIEEKEFDLALRKFITKVDEEEVTTRVPEVSYNREENQITYNHTKEPVEVVTGNVVEYTIRVFNEGDMAGYASEITDDIPDGLRFLPENETNVEYRWIMYDEQGNITENVEEAVEIRTDYLSKEQEKTEGENLLQAFNPDEPIGEGNPDYRDVKIAFEVVEPNESDRIIVNSAQISEDSDEEGNPIEDIDSTPDEWNEGEDDQDREYIKLTYFDLALRKWVTEAIVIEDGKETVTQTGHIAEMDPEPVVKVELYRKDLNDVTVKFRYKIRVTNEGDIAGYAKEITDYVPEGLMFVAEDNPGWTDEGNNIISTRLLENTLLQPGETAEVEVVLTWINGEDNMGQMTNIAEISEDYNDKGVPDRDSTPDNQVEGEDDIDDAPVLLSIETGRAVMYFTLGFTVLGTLAGGLVLIKRFVL